MHFNGSSPDDTTKCISHQSPPNGKAYSDDRLSACPSGDWFVGIEEPREAYIGGAAASPHDISRCGPVVKRSRLLKTSVRDVR